MAESSRQKRITGRVMHEFRHGELKRGRSGKGGKVKSRRQAIAIAMSESGQSRRRRGRKSTIRSRRKTTTRRKSSASRRTTRHRSTRGRKKRAS
jgi:Family of unknown function (DUF6496)